jgi:phospholipid transport system substrate-binding protein
MRSGNPLRVFRCEADSLAFAGERRRRPIVRLHARVVSTLILLLVLVSAHGAWAGPPTDQLRDGVDRVLKVLRDPELRSDTQINQRRVAIGKVADEIFDFGDMAQRALGQHWTQRTSAERGEFVRLFTDLVQRAYVSKVDQHAVATKMTFRGETMDGDYAVVQTTIPLSNGSKMPIDYRMHNTRDYWQVYDLSIDGISLVANYRAQFNRVIRTSSYAALVTRLKSQQADFSSPSASPAGVDAPR